MPILSDIVARLRNERRFGSRPTEISHLMNEAADALESLQRDLVALKHDVERYVVVCREEATRADNMQRERDEAVARWRTPDNKPVSISPHHSVTVLAVIDDHRYRINGDDPFVDIAAYWPALDKWTITSQCRADAEVDDYPVNAAFWMPLPESPVKREMTLIAALQPGSAS